MNSAASRRAFLQRATVLPFAAAFPFSKANAAIEPIKRVGPASLKPALNAYSFLELLNANDQNASTGIDLFGICDFAAKHDCAAVDLTGYFFPGYPNAPDDSYLIRLKRHAFNLGLSISGTGVRNDFTTADDYPQIGLSRFLAYRDAGDGSQGLQPV